MAITATAGDLRPGDRVTAYYRMGKWKKVDFVVGKVEGVAPNLVLTFEAQTFGFYHFQSTVKVQFDRPEEDAT